jgi:hypothetical protein
MKCATESYTRRLEAPYRLATSKTAGRSRSSRSRMLGDSVLAVGESVQKPLLYWDVNLNGSRTLVFSSTATVVGEPDQFPITEAFPTNPLHPYAQTKLAVEWLLAGKTRRASPTTCFASGEKIPMSWWSVGRALCRDGWSWQKANPQGYLSLRFNGPWASPGPPLLADQGCGGLTTVPWCFPLSRQGSPPECCIEPLRPLASRATGARMNCSRLRLHHISTDEVFGSLGETGRFSETTTYAPRSPYSATRPDPAGPGRRRWPAARSDSFWPAGGREAWRWSRQQAPKAYGHCTALGMNIRLAGRAVVGQQAYGEALLHCFSST